jgi:predicted ArsR family transcriptional regulator
MGRRSALTKAQWLDVESRHVVDGVSINELAKKFKVNESTIRRKIKPLTKTGEKRRAKPENPLKTLALQKVAADKTVQNIAEIITALPYSKQDIVLKLVKKLNNVAHHLASAAEYGAMTSHRLAQMANTQAETINPENPMESANVLLSVKALTELSNAAAKTGVDLLRANGQGAMEESKEAEVIDGAVIEKVDPIEAARVYQRMISG